LAGAQPAIIGTDTRHEPTIAKAPILGRMSLCRVASFNSTGRRVELSKAERDRMMLADRDVRREVLRASRMYGPHGCLIILREPSTGLEDLGQPVSRIVSPNRQF
jgi:hypothetical protein